MVFVLLFVFFLFLGRSFATYEQLNKQIYCTPSEKRHDYSVGLAFGAPYKGKNYGELPTADGTTFVTTHVEIYDHTCKSPLYTTDIVWDDVNSTVYAIDNDTSISLRFPAYPDWRRYGKQCYQNGNIVTAGYGGMQVGIPVPGTGLIMGIPEQLESECEDYESLYQCDASSPQDNSFCSIKLGNLTIETVISGTVLREQYSRLFKYARTDVGDACNCWQEMDGYNYVFACGCAVSTDLIIEKLSGATPPSQDFYQNYNQVKGLPKVDPASTTSVRPGIGGPNTIPVTYPTTTKPSTTTSKHSIVTTHSASHKTTSKSATPTKSHSGTSHATAGTSTHKPGQTISKTTSHSGKHSSTPIPSKSSPASACSLSPVSGTLAEHCTKETTQSSPTATSACSLSPISGTLVEHCAKETATHMSNAAAFSGMAKNVSERLMRFTDQEL